MPMPTLTKEEFRAKEEAERKDGFAHWMSQPATRMMISMIPAGEHREVLETLLQETFNTGYSCGGSRMMMSVVEAALSSKSRRDGEPHT